MKKAIYSSLLAAVMGMAAAGCTSYEIDMPANPAAPVVGNEVSTDVVYQANPRFFAENECLKALTAQLPRISEMNCDILWVMLGNRRVSLRRGAWCVWLPWLS